MNSQMQLDGHECFKASSKQGGRRLREVVPGNKWTQAFLQGVGGQTFVTWTDPSEIWALRLKPTVKKNWFCVETSLEKSKKVRQK